MQEKKFNNNETAKSGKDGEKILYSTNRLACFACGEKIEKGTKVCPYCKTSIL